LKQNSLVERELIWTNFCSNDQIVAQVKIDRNCWMFFNFYKCKVEIWLDSYVILLRHM